MIAGADRMLIVVSDPIDPDCLGTGLALAWWLEHQGKQATLVSFRGIPPAMRSFPDAERIQEADAATFEFDPYQLVFLVDGSSWGQFFGSGWPDVLQRIDTARIISLDHHQPEEIYAAVQDRCLTVQTSCTAQVLYEYFIEPDGIRPPAHVADYMYQALLYDARMFKNEMHPGEYAFAETLIALGADHDRAVDTNYDKREMDFFVWAAQHTEYVDDIGVTLLTIDSQRADELTRIFGREYADWMRLYKETFQRQIKGYHYGIILKDNLDGTVRLNWRTRNFGRHLSIAEVARTVGFKAGGHRNAGGGVYSGTIAEARKQLIGAMRRALHA